MVHRDGLKEARKNVFRAANTMDDALWFCLIVSADLRQIIKRASTLLKILREKIVLREALIFNRRWKVIEVKTVPCFDEIDGSVIKRDSMGTLGDEALIGLVDDVAA